MRVKLLASFGEAWFAATVTGIFIDRVTNSPEAAGLVKAILRLARTFQLATVAEGVEQTAQLERLQSLGCDQIQGLVAPPMPAKEVAEYLTARTAGVLAAG